MLIEKDRQRNDIKEHIVNLSVFRAKSDKVFEVVLPSPDPPFFEGALKISSQAVGEHA